MYSLTRYPKNIYLVRYENQTGYAGVMRFHDSLRGAIGHALDSIIIYESHDDILPLLRMTPEEKIASIRDAVPAAHRIYVIPQIHFRAMLEAIHIMYPMLGGCHFCDDAETAIDLAYNLRTGV